MEYFTPTIDVQDNKAVVTFDETFLSYIANANDLFIDLYGTAEYDSVEMNFTKEQIAALKAKSLSLTLNNEAVELDIPLSNLEEKDTTISFAKTESIEDALTDTYDFEISQEGQALTEFKEEVTIAFFLEGAKNPRVYYVDRENEELVELEGMYEDDAVYGYTSHFSEFTVLESENQADPVDPSDPIDPNDPNDPNDPTNPADPDNSGGTDADDNGSGNGSDSGNWLPDTATSSFNFILVGLSILLAGSGIYLFQRRRLSDK